VKLRPATVDDVPALAALEHKLFGPEGWSADATTEELTSSDRGAVVACDADGSVVGYAVVRRSDDLLDLHRIAVGAEHRRAGVARALLDELRRVGRESGASQMLLEVSAANTGALGFYAAEGFVQIDRRPRYYRDGSDAVVMRGPVRATGCGAAS
jgi:ribosomal-protein-alanine acetyltransferase